MKTLEGVKILDVTHVQLRPCATLLAGFGANVIKLNVHAANTRRASRARRCTSNLRAVIARAGGRSSNN